MMLDPREPWPPDYNGIINWRIDRVNGFRGEDGPNERFGAYKNYANDPIQFCEDWIDTFDPRNAAKEGELTRMPFVLFKRQRQLIRFFKACLDNEANGLVEKSRDMGATWCAVAFSVWLWLFVPGSSVGFGSRKAQLVDRIGDVDSIFEKLRLLLRALPPEFKPSSYDAMFMKLVNNDNGAMITGESGDEIGRGGRKSIYFVDEAAHLEHLEGGRTVLRDEAARSGR
jgi:phage terminase large subunit